MYDHFENARVIFRLRFNRDPSLTSPWEGSAAGFGMRPAPLAVPETMFWNTCVCVFPGRLPLSEWVWGKDYRGLGMLKASLTHSSTGVTTVHYTSSHTASAEIAPLLSLSLTPSQPFSVREPPLPPAFLHLSPFIASIRPYTWSPQYTVWLRMSVTIWTLNTLKCVKQSGWQYSLKYNTNTHSPIASLLMRHIRMQC